MSGRHLIIKKNCLVYVTKSISYEVMSVLDIRSFAARFIFFNFKT